MITKHIFEIDLPSGPAKVTSLVMDPEEFEDFISQLTGLFDAKSGERAGEAGIQAIREARTLPMMSRGTKTQRFFDQFGVETDLLSAIVRGAGPKMYQTMTESMTPEQIEESWTHIRKPQ